MLRSAGIRSKILAVLVVPLVLLGITTGLLATQQVQQARQAYQVEKIAEIGGPFAQLVRGIGAERAVTAAALQGSPEALEALPGVRAQVDEGVASSRTAVAEIDFSRLSEQSEQALARVESAHVELTIIRGKVDGGGAAVDSVMAGFADVLREDLAMPGRVAAGVTDQRTADLLVGFGALLTTRDLALREQEIGLRVLSRTPTAADGREFATLATAQEDELARWQFAVGSAEADRMAELMGQQRQTVWSIGRARVALSSPSTVAQTGLTPELWAEVTDARIAALDASLAGTAADLQTQAEATSQRATLLAALAVAAAVLGVGVTVLLSLVLARRIARPLRELTAAAADVRELLPRMVEQMRSPGQMPDVELPRIEVLGDDEVGRLAAAFNAVNDTVVEVAEEQAALRGSIAETFVNVARRNQVLLSRQLSFIDQLEQREENPDTLENLFRLDHLATRMRRNAESLLVLANIDAGRKLRQPLALSDVIRTAASEIEQYERVNLALQVDPPTMGHLALQLAHLLAEILENGTNFSEPHTPVLVATSRTATGIRITVTDEGLGLTDDEIEQARTKISDAAADDVVTSQRLGFFVVGRLARRLGVTVSIRRGSAKGLVVTVDLPPSLFVPGTVRVAAPEGGTQQAGPTAPSGPASRPRALAAGSPPAQVGPAPQPAPAARPPQPRPATPVAARGAAIPMPTVEPTADPQVTVTPGGPSLPRRGSAQAPTGPVQTVPTAAPQVPAAPVAPVPVVQAPVVQAPVVPPAPAPTQPTPVVQPSPVAQQTPVIAPRQAPAAALPVPVPPAAEEEAPAPTVPDTTTSLPTRARREPVAAPAPAPALSAAVPSPAASPAVPSVAPSVVPSPTPSAAVPTPAPERTAEPVAVRAPGTPSAPAADRTPPPDPVLPFTGLLGDDEQSTPRGSSPVHPPRRAGLFGAFRARREVGGPAEDVTTTTGAPPAGAPSTGAPVPPAAPNAVPPAAPTPRPAIAGPVVPPTAPAHRAAQPPVTALEVPAAAPSARPTPAAAPSARPTLQPAPVAVPPVAAPTVPSAAPSARPTPRAAPAPAPAAPAPGAARPAVAPAVGRPTPAEPVTPAGPPRPTPVDILPGGARRRGRRSLFGSGRAATPPPPAPTPSAPSGPAAHAPVAPAPSARPSFPTVPAQSTGPSRHPASPAPAAGVQPLLNRSAPTAGGPADGEDDRAHPVGAVLGGVPVVPALADGEAMRQRSMLASEALSELSRLSSYSPSTVEGRGGPAPLVRRQPAATEGAKLPAPPSTPAPERRPRSAADVRSMLSGFQSGVTRGRAGGGEDADPDAPDRVPAPSAPGRAPTGPTTATSTTDTSTTD